MPATVKIHKTKIDKRREEFDAGLCWYCHQQHAPVDPEIEQLRAHALLLAGWQYDTKLGVEPAWIKGINRVGSLFHAWLIELGELPVERRGQIPVEVSRNKGD